MFSLCYLINLPVLLLASPSAIGGILEFRSDDSIRGSVPNTFSFFFSFECRFANFFFSVSSANLATLCFFSMFKAQYVSCYDFRLLKTLQ